MNIDPRRQFFYLDGNKNTIGPLSWEVIEQLANSGAITGSTMIAEEGEQSWIAFEQYHPSQPENQTLPPPPGSERKKENQPAAKKQPQEGKKHSAYPQKKGPDHTVLMNLLKAAAVITIIFIMPRLGGCS